ncbi:uncharacterized protein LOC124923750 isoform X2 [Impatiens glandulifera]|uniref:uncharacterized protein LOC124923750 isoform X2 n=1 Tax=Impatiens glandulifera TaxID=253017 RepID=UPI001FB1894F|nr:uncharacterized protein LOC124923750 isoform X2 [Impatiens glandulifera]
MTTSQNLPFKAGQMVESRSFTSGFRGAWFRGKIKGISRRKGYLEYSLEFIDFPDEKIYWTKAYQVNPVNKRKRKEMPMQLMVRPKYPIICHQKGIPDANTVQEDTVVVLGSWKVGDYVDWWTDGCYWSGIVTEILDNGKLKVDLLPPPLGEGSSYTVDCKDLRLSLDWSLEFEWSVPIQEREDSCPTARLIKPLNLGSHTNVDNVALEKGVENTESICGQPSLNNTVSASSISTSVLIPEAVNDPMMEDAVEASSGGLEQVAEAVEASGGEMEQVEEASVPMEIDDCSTDVKANCSDSVVSSNISNNILAEKTAAAEEEGETNEEKDTPDREVSLNSMHSSADTIDAAVMDLEELIIRINWLKGILDCPQSNPDSPPSFLWDFVEPHA